MPDTKQVNIHKVASIIVIITRKVKAVLVRDLRLEVLEWVLANTPVT